MSTSGPFHTTAVLTPTSPFWPSAFATIPSTEVPPLLYCRGNVQLLQSPCVALVGPRVPTRKGVQAARVLGYLLARRHYTVVSGLADGIDTAAHLGALAEGGGRTIAVLPTPLDAIYSPHNEHLAARIVEAGGLLVTEYRLPARARERFVLRNRIQAALSLAVVPVQCANQSGTMHTVRYARRYGRIVLCPDLGSTEHERSLEQYCGLLTLIEGGTGSFSQDSQLFAFLESVGGPG